MTKALAGKHVRAALACAAALTLAACSEEPFDVASQIGPNPNLPPLQQYLFPPMHLARVVGWKEGEKLTVADGLKIEALATGLQHPRSVYVLPNGDVLVVQSKQPWPDPIHRPKDMVMGWVESWVTSGGDTGPSNRITLLRDADGDGKPETQSVFLDHLNSPFGVALVGNDLTWGRSGQLVIRSCDSLLGSDLGSSRLLSCSTVPQNLTSGRHSERLTPKSLILEVIGLGRMGPIFMAASCSQDVTRPIHQDPTRGIPRGYCDDCLDYACTMRAFSTAPSGTSPWVT